MANIMATLPVVINDGNQLITCKVAGFFSIIDKLSYLA